VILKERGWPAMETSGADKNTSLFCDFSREIFQKPFSVKAVK
jgi:hypothetical protein